MSSYFQRLNLLYFILDDSVFNFLGQSMSKECETAITKTGWGLCNYFIISLCSLCTMAEAGASLIIVIVSPLLACDLKYNEDKVMTMNATSSLGMAFGGFFFGTLADMNGRKESIPVTMIIIFCGSMGLSFAQTYFLINLSVFLLGVGVAGNNAILRVYVIECLPSRKRGSCLAVIDFLWIIGYVTFLGIFWSMAPSVIKSLQGKDFRPSSWKVMAGLGAAPILILACATSLLPSSPRYLLYRRQPEQALAVLRQMYAVNFSRHADKYPLRNLDGCVEPDEDEGPEENKTIKKIIRKYFSKTRQRMQKIFTPPFLRISFLCITACCLQFSGLIWLALWNSKVLNDTHAMKGFIPTKSNVTCTLDSGSMVTAFVNNCKHANNAHFQTVLLTSLSFALGEIFLVLAIDKFGRRLFLISSGLIGSTALITFTFATSHTTRNVLSAFFLSAYAISYTTVTILLLENYPTALRGTMMGFARILPHLVGFFMKFFMKLSCLTTLYIASGIMIGTAITAILLPDLTNSPMQE